VHRPHVFLAVGLRIFDVRPAEFRGDDDRRVGIDDLEAGRLDRDERDFENVLLALI
jgi:hypothetical protein